MAEIEEHLLSISEALNGMRLLESRMNEISLKGDKIDKMADRLEAMPIRELMIRDEALEDKDTNVVGFKHRDCSTGSIARIKDGVESLYNVIR